MAARVSAGSRVIRLTSTRSGTLSRNIVRDGRRAGDVIARIRALTKGTPSPREKLDLSGTVQEVLALIGDEARKNKVTVRTRFAEDAHAVLGIVSSCNRSC